MIAEIVHTNSASSGDARALEFNGTTDEIENER